MIKGIWTLAEYLMIFHYQMQMMTGVRGFMMLSSLRFSEEASSKLRPQGWGELAGTKWCERMTCEMLGGCLPGRENYMGTALKVKESYLGLKAAQWYCIRGWQEKRLRGRTGGLEGRAKRVWTFSLQGNPDWIQGLENLQVSLKVPRESQV